MVLWTSHFFRVVRSPKSLKRDIQLKEHSFGSVNEHHAWSVLTRIVLKDITINIIPVTNTASGSDGAGPGMYVTEATITNRPRIRSRQ